MYKIHLSKMQRRVLLISATIVTEITISVRKIIPLLEWDRKPERKDLVILVLAVSKS